MLLNKWFDIELHLKDGRVLFCYFLKGKTMEDFKRMEMITFDCVIHKLIEHTIDPKKSKFQSVWIDYHISQMGFEVFGFAINK